MRILPKLTCEYELENEDIRGIEEAFAGGIVSPQTISVTSYYDNSSKITGIDVTLNAFKEWLIYFGVGEQGKELIPAATLRTQLRRDGE